MLVGSGKITSIEFESSLWDILSHMLGSKRILTTACLAPNC